MEEEGIFMFEDEEAFGKAATPPNPFVHVTKLTPCCDSRLASLEHEEIVNLRPRDNVSYEVSPYEYDYGWSSSGSSGSSSNNGGEKETESGGLGGLMDKLSLDNNNENKDCACCISISYDEMNNMTIESLRVHLYTCFTCGVHWREEQVSLDCRECDGYAMTRPCCVCEGQCGSLWTRDLSQSHSQGRAQWSGTCNKEPGSDGQPKL